MIIDIYPQQEDISRNTLVLHALMEKSVESITQRHPRRELLIPGEPQPLGLIPVEFAEKHRLDIEAKWLNEFKNAFDFITEEKNYCLIKIARRPIILTNNYTESGSHVRSVIVPHLSTIQGHRQGHSLNIITTPENETYGERHRFKQLINDHCIKEIIHTDEIASLDNHDIKVLDCIKQKIVDSLDSLPNRRVMG